MIATWEDPAADERCRGWARATRVRLDDVASTRTYLNFLGESEVPGVRRAIGEAKHDRLRRLKRRYDPHNLFRRNPNILPAD